MDNLTHTLVGLVAGEAVSRLAPSGRQGLGDDARRKALITVGMVGSNLPDIDLAWSMRFVTGDDLGYLLHHRGHTHTVLGCLLLAAVLLLAVWAWMRWRRRSVSLQDWQLLAVMASLSVGLHLGMDALNSYGVHPFWPLDNRWYYGDSVFIIEPLYWLAVAPLLLVFRSRLARVLLGTVLVVASGVLWVAHAGWLPVLAAPLPALLLVLAGWRRSPRFAALAGLALMLSVTLLFGAAGSVAERRIEAIAERSFPDARTLDIVLSPAPANPLCWDLMLVQSPPERLVIRQGQLSLLDSLDARQCPATQRGSVRTAPFAPVAAGHDSGVHWLGEFEMPLARLVAVAESDCRAREMLQFLRAPFLVERVDGWLLGDLRFDREAGAGFAEELLPRGGGSACSYDVPWVAPRADIL